MNGCSGLSRLPEDDTIFLVLNYCMSFGIYSYDRPVLAHRAVDFLGTFAIMYLTRQPTGRCKLPDPANKQLHYVSRPIRPKMQGGLLIFQIQN